MAERIVIANPFENQIATVGPTARPVDIYQKARVKTSGFEHLKKALDSYSQKALPALGRIEQRAAEKEFAQGQELFNKTRTSMGEAVKAGLIDEGESPYLRKGYRVARLNTLGARYADELATALTSKKLYKNGNPEAIEKFTTEFYSEFQEKNEFGGFIDTEIAEFFSGSAAKANENFRSSWKQKHTAWQKAENYRMLTDEVSTMTATSFKDTDTPDQRAQKTEFLTTWLNDKIASAKIDGMDNAKVNQAVVDSIVLSAFETNDATVLDVLDNVITGTGPLGFTKEARSAVFDAQEKIAVRQDREDKKALTFQKQQNEIAVDAASTLGFAAAQSVFEGAVFIEDNPDTPEDESKLTPDDLLQSALSQLYDVGTDDAMAQARAIQNYYLKQRTAGKDNRNVDDAAYANALVDILQQPNITQATNYVARGLDNGILSGDQAKSLLSFYGRNQTKAGKPRKPTYQDTTYGIDKMITEYKKIIVGNEMSGASNETNRLLAWQFGEKFGTQYMLFEDEFRKVNDNAYPNVLQAQEIARTVIGQLQTDFISAETFIDADAEQTGNKKSYLPRPPKVVVPKEPDKGFIDGITPQFLSDWWNSGNPAATPDF